MKGGHRLKHRRAVSGPYPANGGRAIYFRRVGCGCFGVLCPSYGVIKHCALDKADEVARGDLPDG